MSQHYPTVKLFVLHSEVRSSSEPYSSCVLPITAHLPVTYTIESKCRWGKKPKPNKTFSLWLHYLSLNRPCFSSNLIYLIPLILTSTTVCAQKSFSLLQNIFILNCIPRTFIKPSLIFLYLKKSVCLCVRDWKALTFFTASHSSYTETEFMLTGVPESRQGQPKGRLQWVEMKIQLFQLLNINDSEASKGRKM